MVRALDEFEIDEGIAQLRRAGAEVPLRGKPFQVLAYLARNAERVVSKHELLARIWPDTTVCESSLANCVSEIRAAIGDTRGSGSAIQTVYGRGYRFVARLGRSEDAKPAARSSGVEREPDGESPRSVFVGRERPLRRLDLALEEAFRGAGSAVLLLGEPGIGKTRLAEHLADRATKRGARVLTVRAAAGGAAPLAPWIDLLRRQLDDRERRSICASLGVSIEELGETLACAPPVASSSAASPRDAGAARARTFRALAAALAEIARRTPCVLFVDDLERADQASLLLIEYLARELHAERVLVLGAIDVVPRQRANALTRFVADLKRESGAETITLFPLRPAEVERFIARVRGRNPEADLVSAIYARTEGHPLVLRELVELLADSGWPRGGAASAIPPGLEATAQLRFERIGSDCRRILEVAAVGGREFDVSRIQRVAGTDPANCLEELDRALAAGLIAEISPRDRPGWYRFAHSLLRDVLYDALPTRERVELHRRHAGELEAQDADPGEIAEHLAHSNDPADLEKAISCAERAGRRAARRGGYDRAAAHYERALAALARAGAPDALRRCDLLLAHAGALRWSHQYRRAREVLREAIDAARASGAHDRLAGAALVWSGPDTFGTADRARVVLVEEALRAAGTAESRIRVYLLLCLLAARWSIDPPERTNARAREVLGMADRLGDGAARASARWFVHASLQSASQISERREIRREALHIAAEAGDRGVELLTRAVLIGDLVEDADASGLDREIAVMERIAAPGDHLLLLSAIGMRALLRGELAEAERRLEPVWGDAQLARRGVACPPGFACQMFALRREQGRVGEVEPILRAGKAQMPAFGLWRLLLAVLLLETGRDTEAAREVAAVFEAGIARLPRHAFWLGGLVLLGEAVAAVGSRAQARELYRLLEPFADRVAAMRSYACVDPVGLALGRLAGACGWRRRAADHLCTARSLAARLHAAPSLARIEKAQLAMRIS